MNIMNTIRSKSHKVAIALLAGAAAFGTAQMAGAFGLEGAVDNPNRETCAFTVQLQKSVSVRQKFLIEVDMVLGKGYKAQNAVEEMYGNITPAAYSASEKEQSPFGSAKPGKSRIDPLSADCLGCHDGVGATNIAVDFRNNPLSRRSHVDSFSSDHPIGMNYEQYVDADRGFKTVDGTGASMIFVNGRVGCLTCHNPLNPQKGHLVKSDRNSALCYTCHDK